MGRRGFLLIAWNGCGMCKEQRKLLLMVKLGSVIPIKLFQKFNICDNCEFAIMTMANEVRPRRIGRRKECHKRKTISIIHKNGKRYTAQYCYNWKQCVV